MNRSEREVLQYDITPLRGGSIGLISGFKGGGLAGALGGALLMVSNTAATGVWQVIIFSLILSLTTGLMAGGLIGMVYGLVAGGLSGGLLSRRPAAATGWIWLLLGVVLSSALAVWLYQEALLTGMVAGVLLGLLAGRIGGRDFDRMVAEQKVQVEQQ